MAILKPKTKEDALDNISNEILDKYLLNKSGLHAFSECELKKYLDKAEDNKAGNYATYHYIHALVYTVKYQYKNAEYSYKVALQNDSSDLTILSNYTTLLIEMNKYAEAYEIAKDLIRHHKFYKEALMNNLYRIALSTLELSYLEDFADDEIVIGYLKGTEEFLRLREDLSSIEVSVSEYTEFMELLSKFVLQETRQNFRPRFSIDNGLDRNLKIELFLDINADEAVYLDSKFTDFFVDYVFDNNRHDLLGKFVIFFRQDKNRYDGTEDPEALYLGVHEEIGA
jgi:hypothetical protein